MNIFLLDEDPIKAAICQCDQHIVKMPLESAQILSTVAWKKGFAAPYKPTHINHPCTIWASKSSANYDWLILHAKALCEEYTRRYRKIHKTQAVIEHLGLHKPILPEIGLTPFALAIYGNDPIKRNLCIQGSAVNSYRRFYKMDKGKFARWRYGNQPEWWDSIIIS